MNEILINQREIRRQRSRRWYLKNREYHINKVQKYQKDTNYVSEKSEKQRKLRYIKRRTRFLFPLANQKCKCGEQATEHHHTTQPIAIDKFEFVCHKCHIQIHENIRLKIDSNGGQNVIRKMQEMQKVEAFNGSLPNGRTRATVCESMSKLP